MVMLLLNQENCFQYLVGDTHTWEKVLYLILT